MDSLKTCFIICGPTAVGKTSLAIELAKTFQTSIISADSRQCYRELNIGVAKPAPEQLSAVPHYFINSHSIFAEVNAAGFDMYAEAAAAKIFTRESNLVMVGGTGLYINSFCDGLDNIPAVDPAVRKRVREQYQHNGMGWLRNALIEMDPLFGAPNGEMTNPQRMMRALEVILSTGASIRSYQHSAKKIKPYRVVKIGLEFPRDELYHRINRRVDEMIASGLEDEVKNLLEYKDLNALNTVGYKEIIAFLEGKCTLGEAVERIKQNTRHYSKRQITWFKKDTEITWFSAAQIQQIINYCVDIANNRN